MRKVLRVLLIFLVILSAISYLKAENNFITIDTVYNFTKGTGQSFGQAPKFYPKNIFQKPDVRADSTVPCADPHHLLSLGLNGEITVGFKNYRIIDGPGTDFIIYENVFYSEITERYFVEPAAVSVSENGVDFVEFPWNKETMEGCAGMKPTYGNMVDVDILQSGGDHFDLEKVGLKAINYIRIKDVTEMIMHPDHPLFDGTLSGFDLNAVVGINYESTKSSVEQLAQGINFRDYLKNNPDAKLVIYNVNGQIVAEDFSQNYDATMANLHSGIYFVTINNNKTIEYFKVNI